MRHVACARLQVRGLETLALRDVLIVGLGNSAADIAMALLDKGARSVTVSVASVPPIVRREVRACLLRGRYVCVCVSKVCVRDMIS